VARQYSSSSATSARWVCSRTPARRASSADSDSSRVVTENGEQGATATRSIEPGAGSWYRSTAAAVAASAASVSSTSSSGGSPPEDAPRSIEPRHGWNRSPTAAAASTAGASRSPRPGGNT
jgi:hypothetical protein